MCIKIAAHQTECETRRRVLVNSDKDLVLYHPFEKPPKCSHASNRERGSCKSHGSCCQISRFEFCLDEGRSLTCRNWQWHHLVVSAKEAEELNRKEGVEPYMAGRPIPLLLEDEKMERIRRDLFNAGAVLWSRVSDARAMERALISLDVNAKDKARWEKRHSKVLDQWKDCISALEVMERTWKVETERGQIEVCLTDGLEEHPWGFAFQRYVDPDRVAGGKNTAGPRLEQEAEDDTLAWRRAIDKEMTGIHRRLVDIEIEQRRHKEEHQYMLRRQTMNDYGHEEQSSSREEAIYSQDYGYVRPSPQAGPSRQEQDDYENEGEIPDARTPLLFRTTARNYENAIYGLPETPPNPAPQQMAPYHGGWSQRNSGPAVVGHQSPAQEDLFEGYEYPDDPLLSDIHVRAAIPSSSSSGRGKRKIVQVISSDEADGEADDEEPEEAGPSRRGVKHRRME